VYDKTRLTIQGLPVAANANSYGLLIKSYMKYVHNRPMDSGLSSNQFEYRKVLRNRQLWLFCIIGVPLTTFLLIIAPIPLKELFTLTIGELQVANSNSNLINSTIFLSTLINKIPR